MGINIGLVEDEKNLNDLIRSYLEKEDYRVFTYENAEEAIKDIDYEIHLWIVDIMLPGKSGFEILEEIKKVSSKVPVIFISARDQDFDKIIGLEKGADDYLAKPFSTKELILRVKKLLDRCYEQEDVISIAGYTINLKTHKVYDHNEILDLSNREYSVLVLFYKNRERPLTRDQILDYVWRRDYFGNDRAVDDLIRRLRRKMSRLELETIYGYGYRLKEK